MHQPEPQNTVFAHSNLKTPRTLSTDTKEEENEKEKETIGHTILHMKITETQKISSCILDNRDLSSSIEPMHSENIHPHAYENDNVSL